MSVSPKWSLAMMARRRSQFKSGVWTINPTQKTMSTDALRFLQEAKKEDNQEVTSQTHF